MAADRGSTARSRIEIALLASGYRGDEIARMIQQVQLEQPPLTKSAPSAKARPAREEED